MGDSTNTTLFEPKGPQRIGRYEIVSELGRGAMGIVFKGFDPTIGRTVAIKTIHMNSDNQEVIERFKREARAAGGLSHPAIVTIYDAGEDQGVFYIAMEFVEGETLQSIIADGPMHVDRATSIVEDVAGALDLAHSRQIIHRDIKPANIMIANGRAKVMDFGVAKMASTNATATGMVIGTPSYMSPEGVKGQPVDGRADIFSLGVVLYEMLTGKRPFVGDSIPSVIYKIVGERPALATISNPQLHAGLDVVLLKALEKDPYDRYQTCADLVKDLRSYRDLRAAPVPPPVAAPVTVAAAPKAKAIVAKPDVAKAKPASKSMLPVIAGVIGVLLVAGVGWWGMNRNASPAAIPQAAPTVVKPAETPAPPPEAAKPSPVVETPPPVVTKRAPTTTATKPASTPAPVVETPAPPTVSKKVEPPPVAAAPATVVAGEGRLRVRSDPSGAKVLVDGADRGYSTPVNFALSAGPHKILVRHKKSEATRDIVVKANEQTDLEVNLRQP